MKKFHSKLLVVSTLVLSSLSLPSFSQQPGEGEDPPEEPPPAIRDVIPFSRKQSFGQECPNPGGGCVITIFEDGTVTATDVD